MTGAVRLMFCPLCHELTGTFGTRVTYLNHYNRTQSLFGVRHPCTHLGCGYRSIYESDLSRHISTIHDGPPPVAPPPTLELDDALALLAKMRTPSTGTSDRGASIAAMFGEQPTCREGEAQRPEQRWELVSPPSLAGRPRDPDRRIDERLFV